MAQDTLGPLERQTLAVLLEHPRDAYGVSIMQRLAERTGRERSLAAIYMALDRLDRKGMVSSSWGEPTAERGGRRKRLYRIEATGVRALRDYATEAAQLGAVIPVGAGA